MHVGKILILAAGVSTLFVACSFLFAAPLDHPNLAGLALMVGFPLAMVSSTCFQYAFKAKHDGEKLISINGIVGILLSAWISSITFIHPIGNAAVDERRIKDDLIGGAIALALTLIFCVNWTNLVSRLRAGTTRTVMIVTFLLAAALAVVLGYIFYMLLQRYMPAFQLQPGLHAALTAVAVFAVLSAAGVFLYHCGNK